jgi:hypothetical protein
MSQLERHHLSVQVGPELALAILKEALAGKVDDEVGSSSYPVSDQQLSAFVSAKAARAVARSSRRKRTR